MTRCVYNAAKTWKMEISDGDSFLDIKRRIFAKTLNYYSSIGRVHCSETTEETTLTFYQQISFAVLVGTKI